MTQEEKVEYMTTAPVRGLVCKLALPTILSMMVTTFYNMADTYFVGKINTSATAAVGVVFSVMALMQAIGFFFGHGSGNYISRMLGARRYEESELMAATGFGLAFLFGILLAILGLIFLEPFALLLGSTDTILPYTKAYMRIILLGTPFITSSMVLNNQLRFQGSAMYAMIGIITGAIINIGLDPLFIFVFNMGIAGAALATILSQIISFSLLCWQSTRGGNIKIRLRNFTPTRYFVREIFRGGFPSLCRQGLASVSLMLLNNAAALYGDAAVAGMSIVNRVCMFANSVLIGYGQGFQPVCGMNYGARKYDRVREAFFFCVKTAFAVLLVAAIAAFPFANQIVEIFRDDPEVTKVGALALRLQLVMFPFGAFIVLTNMMLQAIGKAKKASIVAACRQGVFFIPLVLILPNVFGLLGIQMTQTLSDACSLAVALPMGLGVIKEMK